MKKNVSVEIDMEAIRRRVWEILPGFLSWGTLIGLMVLALVLPFWIAIFVIAYDVYLLIRIVYMSIHLLYAYRRLKEYRSIQWILRLRAQTHPINWNTVHHVIVIPTYDESIHVLRTSIESLVKTDFPKERIHVVVGFEERAGAKAKERAKTLTKEFGSQFKTFYTAFHPDGIEGEKKVKSANATWALQQIEKKLEAQKIPEDMILVSNFDSDTVVSKEYFSYLTYVFVTTKNPYHASYQPIPVYNNNLWDAPSFSRVVAMGSTFWQMIESTRPERLVTFSSHSMTLKALHDVGYWQRNIISEDSRIFWQCLLRYDGDYRTIPLYTTVSMDAALAPTWWQTLLNQYKQKRRWAWGIENFPYLIEGFLHNKKIPLKTKFTYTFRTLEGHYSWATAAIIVAVLGWIPVLFGNPVFHQTFLSYSLPFITRTLMTIAMSGLILSATLTILLLPNKPKHYGPWKYLIFILQWALVPLIATLLSAFPALDSETRLMFGRDLNFNVMQKTRKRVTARGVEAI
ncbi:MAG: glycosyltransferase family 2 protein [bacterium]|nr:glycosyltransferase family 2 protein [bacterium]